MACDHQLFDGPNDPNTLGLNPDDGLHASEVSAVGVSSCVISEWYYDEVTMQWIEACGSNVPVATLSIANFQDFDNVDITFGYIPKPECPTPDQTDGVYTIYDNNGTVVSGPTASQLAATVNFDFSTLLGVPLSAAEYPQDFTFTVEYNVEDVCGISETVSREISVVPSLKEVFTFTGTDQTAVPPTWANTLDYIIDGAAGGGGPTGTFGGNGAKVTGTLTTASYTIRVGEGGKSNNTNSTFGGGGGGGSVNLATLGSTEGCSGGGGTWIFDGASIIAVAGGGGGAGGRSAAPPMGVGGMGGDGGLPGGDGTFFDNVAATYNPGEPGTGATAAAGGVGTPSGAGNTTVGTDGTAGQGGIGGGAFRGSPENHGSGGGGGGLFGGGGGSTGQNLGNLRLNGDAGGGGGSSQGDVVINGGALNNAVGLDGGDGLACITWTV